MSELTPAQKNAEKQRRYRLRQKEAGRHEVRGIYATNEDEAKIKEFSRKLHVAKDM